MIRAASLTGYFRVAHRHGLDPLTLLDEVGLEPGALADPGYRIPVALACRLLDTAAQRADCPTFGLEMAELRQKNDAGAIGILLAHARTLREALHAIVRYQPLLGDVLGIHIDSSSELVTIREEIICNVPGPTRQAVELAVGITAKICRGLLGPHWKPRQVDFAHPAPKDRRFHRSFFGCPVNFDSDFNGIVCTAAELDAPNPMADPALVHYAETLARQGGGTLEGAPLATDVRKMIYLLLPLEQASIDEVARKLNLSTRTLQRQLGAQQADFSGLLADVRAELAVRYLANGRYPIGRIAALLGFSRQGSFTRWFIDRFGMPPRAWRANLRAGAAP